MDLNSSKVATRLAFLVAGFGVACWAPLVPLAKTRLEASDASLGLLLLCLGLGSVVAMQGVGPLASRYGARSLVLAGGAGMAAVLPLLSVAPTFGLMASAVFGFGAFIGAIEVGMNVHAVAVEKRSGRPLMSGFHGLFSIGGFAGSSLLTAVLSASIGGLAGTIAASIFMSAALAFAAPGCHSACKTDPLIGVIGVQN